VACYLAQNGELELRSVIRKLWHQRKSVWLPAIDENKERLLQFCEYTPSTKLVNNRFGIPQPDTNQNISIEPKHLDVVLVPLVAFDKDLNRLGMGGGYYDTTFRFIKQDKFAETKLLGMAYDFQEVEQVPVEKWDMPLDDIIVVPTDSSR